jgi:outer membrane protein OmpA-like peptidoglycan-associated protein
MSRLLILLIGLGLLLVLAFFCVRKHSAAIEDDLATRTRAAFQSQGFEWARSTFDGRTLKLAGAAPSVEMRDRAGGIAAGVWGVDEVDNQITVAAETPLSSTPIVEYNTLLTLTDGKVALNGLVPDQQSRARLVGIVAKQFGAANISGQLKIQSGAPDGWGQAAESAFSQLHLFDKASVQIINTQLNMAGTTSVDAASAQIQSGISRALPNNFRSSFDIQVVEAAADTTQLELASKQPVQEARLLDKSCLKRFDDLLSGQYLYFTLDNQSINAEGDKLLNRIIDMAKDCPNVRIEIGGHTDSQGSDIYNSKLSKRRADVVANQLSEKGINLRRLIAIGFGKSTPIANNASEEGRAKNRRIEFKVVGN